MLPATQIARLFVAGAVSACLLAGCALSKPAQITTATPSCSIDSSPMTTGTELEVLKAAFSRVRKGTLPQLDKQAQDADPSVAQGVVVMATGNKIGAPVLHVDAAALVQNDPAAIAKLTDTNRRLKNARQASGADAPAAASAYSTATAGSTPSAASAPTTVDEELASRIPWLASSNSADLNQSASPQAAKSGLDLITFVVDKKATLLGTFAQGQQTLFGAADSKTMLPSLQQFVGLEPFRLVTLLAAQQIVDYLNGQGTPHKETPQLIALVVVFNASDFLATYFDEYLRSGQFIQVSMNEQTIENDVLQQFEGKLPVKLDDNAKQQLHQTVSKICASLLGQCVSLGTLGKDGFTSLFGQTTQFGGVSIAFNGAAANAPWRPSATAPSVGVFGPQMVQVAIEALFDANGPHPPGLATSTACTSKLFRDDDDSGQCVQSGSGVDRWSTIDTVGNSTQALVTTGVGSLIRGAGIAALNNETVASVVETLAGVSTRKAVQQVMWVCRGPTSARVDNVGDAP